MVGNVLSRLGVRADQLREGSSLTFAVLKNLLLAAAVPAQGPLREEGLQ